MSQQNVIKRARMHLRMDEVDKHKFEQAAAFARQSVSEFVLTAAAEAADRLLEEQKNIKLSKPDWDAFYDALINPPEPNEALISGFSWYKKQQSS